MRKGSHASEETRRKLSESRKGERNPMFGKHNCGWHHTEEARRKISMAKRGDANPMYGIHLTRDQNGNWRGGTTRKDGYVYVLQADHPQADEHGYVAEHRLVMEQRLGRLLEPLEVVHHKDEILDDNEGVNLELYDKNSTHLKGHCIGKARDQLGRFLPQAVDMKLCKS